MSRDNSMTQRPFSPAYLCHSSPEFLAKRVEQLRSVLSDCTLCHRSCRVNRQAGQIGACGGARHATVASWSLSFADEFATLGGNGGVVFCGDNGIHCVYCDQLPNVTSVQHKRGHRMHPDELAGLFRVLQDRGCSCLHWVSATSDLPYLVMGLQRAIPRGLHLPITYHTNAYDSVHTIELLDGIIDSYQVELKYSALGSEDSSTSLTDYRTQSRSVLREMFRQIGATWVRSDTGSLLHGILIHLLVRPYDLSGLRENLEWIATDLSRSAAVCLRAGLRPHLELHGAEHHLSARMTRPLTQTEWELARWTLDETLPNGRHLLIAPPATPPWTNPGAPQRVVGSQEHSQEAASDRL